MDRILARLKQIKEEIESLFVRFDFNNDREATYDRINTIIKLLNTAYPLAGYINWRFQEDLLLNMQQYEHRVYIRVESVPYLKTSISILDRLISILEVENEFRDLIPTQKYYSKNQKFSVLRDLDSILKTAKQEILYYDPYMDHVLVEVFSDVAIQEIKLVLFNANPKFQLWVNELAHESGKNIEYFIPTEKSIHDRYCLIDGTELWQISGSINCKNLNSITISKIVDEKVRQKLVKDLIEQTNSVASK